MDYEGQEKYHLFYMRPVLTVFDGMLTIGDDWTLIRASYTYSL